MTKRDVQRYLAAQADGRRAGRPAPGEVRERTAPPPEYLYHPKPGDRVVPMSPVRKRIADHMSWSARISPHATAFAECDMQRAADLLSARRTAFLAEAGAPLTYTVLIAHQVLGALRDFPVLNSSVVGDAIVYKPSIHLGVAVALPDSDELIVPVVHDADTLSLEGLARAIADKSTRARDHRLRPEDVQGGTFTLTNPGVFGGIGGTPIINQPQVAIVGLGGITQRPVVVEDGIAVHAMMTMTLTFDHRAADGMQAFRFLAAVKTRLEEIGRVT